MTEWEYITLRINKLDNTFPEQLNSMGKVGWELVAINDIQPYTDRCIFKRPKNNK